MNKHLLAGIALAAACTVAGIAFQDSHYRLDVPGQPADQVVLGHRDSPYTGMTWVASRSNNYLQLRFFDKVEGGVCLTPTWAELAADPRLAHLRPAQAPAASEFDPGTLNNSPYITFFPAGLLLNRTVPAAPRVLIVGLGSGVGIAQLAHHFPQAAIEVVDIDPAVIAMVRQHFPLLAWLETQRNTAGEPRLRFVARDARAHITAMAGHGYHMLVLDAYTAGSTIPPHLMTREFFAECAATLADGGTVLANVIGCYGEPDGLGDLRGFAHRVLGGALRSLRAAGLEGAWCIPVLHADDRIASFDRSRARNTIVIAAKHQLSPRRFPAGWERLQAWVPFPELELGRHVSDQYLLAGENRYTATVAPAALVDAAVPALAAAMKADPANDGAPHHTRNARTTDRGLIDQSAAAVRAAKLPFRRGWDEVAAEPMLIRRTIDWVAFPRETWRASVVFARDAFNDPEQLVGPVDGPERDGAPKSWHMGDAPLFTDQTPNADIVNR